MLPAYFELRNRAVFDGLVEFLGALSQNVVATTTTAAVFFVGMLGQYTGGRVAERFDLRRGYLAFHAITIPFAFAMALAADLPLIALAAVYFFFLLGMQPIENTLVARYTPARFRHSAYGFKFILTFGVGSLAVKLTGAVEKALGVTAVYPALGLVSIVLVSTILLLMFNTRHLASNTLRTATNR